MSKQNNFKTFYSLSLAWQLGFLIAASIAGFIFLGLMGDKFFKTQPFLLIIGILIGIIMTIYEVFYLLVPVIQKEKTKIKTNTTRHIRSGAQN